VWENVSLASNVLGERRKFTNTDPMISRQSETAAAFALVAADECSEEGTASKRSALAAARLNAG